jgi:hypothetical protein
MRAICIVLLLVLVMAVLQAHGRAVDLVLRIDNTKSDEDVINRANLIKIKEFILKKGLRETYCNLYNNNPAYHTEGYAYYLNPDSGQENVNCELDKSDFNNLTIRGPGEKNQYRTVDFLDEHYVLITVSWPTENLSVSQTREFVVEAMKKILREIDKEKSETT